MNRLPTPSLTESEANEKEWKIAKSYLDVALYVMPTEQALQVGVVLHGRC
jgi:hypothetical protein